MKTYENLTLDEERALYGIKNASIKSCTFDGPEDGESALKETENLSIIDSNFRLRYPLWHTKNTLLENCTMSENCRAPLWYDNKISLKNCNIKGVKALRECKEFNIDNCDIDSQEFGWMLTKGKINNTKLLSEYPFFMASDIKMDYLNLTGKYSFQYTKNMEIKNSYLDTKDAFWHAENVTVVDSIVRGEYLGWYSRNLTFIGCKIIGTQPLCYAENLVLKDCEMIDCDLSFENSDVNADISGKITSIKNPLSGRIIADAIEEIISTEDSQNSNCQIILRNKNQDKQDSSSITSESNCYCQNY